MGSRSNDRGVAEDGKAKIHMTSLTGRTGAESPRRMTLRVLHLEDNPDDALLLRQSIAKVSTPTIELEQVDCLSAALNRLSREDFDLVLADMKLPDSSGLGTLRSLCAHAPQVPIIILAETFEDAPMVLEVLHRGGRRTVSSNTK